MVGAGGFDVASAANLGEDVSPVWAQLRVIGGTAARPAIYWIDDQDCGLYRLGPNHLGVGVAAAKVLDITPGALGICYDAGAYFTITQADGGPVTLNSVSDGTPGIIFVDPTTWCVAGQTAVPGVGLLGGAGTSGTRQSIGAGGDGVKAFSYYLSSTNVTAAHSQTGFYFNMDYGVSSSSAAPSGDAMRGRAYLVGDAAGGNAVTGGAWTVELASTGASNTGLTAGSRGNIVLPNGVMTNPGTYSGAMAEVFLGGAATDTTAYTEIAPLGIEVGGTAPTAASQVANMVAIAIRVPSNMVTSDGTMVVTGGAADTCDAKVEIAINNTRYWIMLSTDDE